MLIDPIDRLAQYSQARLASFISKNVIYSCVYIYVIVDTCHCQDQRPRSRTPVKKARVF